MENATEATNFQHKLWENHDLTAQPIIAHIYLREPDGMHPVCITFQKYCKARCHVNYFVARMKNTALYKGACTGNFSVEATEKLPPDAAWPIPEATGMFLIRIGCTCFSLSAR